MCQDDDRQTIANKQSSAPLVDQIEKDQLEHQEQKDLSSPHYPVHHQSLLLQRLQRLQQIQVDEGYGVDHAVYHQDPVQPAEGNYAQQKYQDEATERIPVYAYQLYSHN